MFFVRPFWWNHLFFVGIGFLPLGLDLHVVKSGFSMPYEAALTIKSFKRQGCP